MRRSSLQELNNNMKRLNPFRAYLCRMECILE